MGEVQREHQQHAKDDDDGDESMESSSKSVDVSASAPASEQALGKDDQHEQERETHKDNSRPLTRREILNLTFALLAWACTICNVTLSTYRTSFWA